MGYLDNSTITVDAILTKQGRLKIANGQPLNISYFTVTDTGVDYTTWNPDHPSGSAYYGEAIENTPNIEALPNVAYFMQRNTLVTLDKNTTAMPHVYNLPDHSFGATFNPFTWTPELGNYVDNSGWTLLVPRDDVVNIVGLTGAQISGNMLQFLSEQDINLARAYPFSTSFTIEPKTNTEGTKVVSCIVVQNGTGAWNSFEVTVENNSIKATTKTDPINNW